MNKRDAKKAAYSRAASIIQSALDGADQSEYLEPMYGEQGAQLVIDALHVLIEELDRRAG